MSKNCTISFDQNEHGTYFTGQVISGRVIINFNKQKKLKGIKLEISGFAGAQWRDRHGNSLAVQDVRRRRKNVFFGREDYIASTTYLIGSEQGQNITIEAGTYTYTFACPIPTNCPSSFEGSFGHIRYLAKVTFIRSGASNRTHNVGFTVLKLLDLNLESKLLQEPANTEAIEYFCLMHAKPVHLRLSIAQTGYVPGQFMLINANVRNASSADCKKLVIMLHLCATYTADTPSLRTTSEKIMLLRKECGPVPHHSEKSFCETLRIPATAPTCEHLSKIIRISYEVSVMAVMNWLMSNPIAMIPITIGNVPLATVAASTYAGPGASVNGYTPMPNDLPTTSARAMALAQSGTSEDDFVHENLEDYELPEDGDDEIETEDELVNQLPPPTYEEAMFMTTDIADTDVNTVSEASRFTPRYPVFDVDNFQSPPPNPPQKRRRRRRRRTQNGENSDKKTVVVANIEATPQAQQQFQQQQQQLQQQQQFQQQQQQLQQQQIQQQLQQQQQEKQQQTEKQQLQQQQQQQQQLQQQQLQQQQHQRLQNINYDDSGVESPVQI